jgi:von Willebrand factor type A domain
MRNSVISACGVMLLAACGPMVVSDQPTTSSRCLSLSEPGATGLTASLPSRVSWLFRVDTCAGEPVSALSATQFEIFEDGKKVSAFESQQRVAPKGERFRLYSVVLLDLSGSVLRSGNFPALQAGAKQYLETALKDGGDGHRVALMTFDGREAPQVLVPFSSNLTALQAGLDSLSVSECSVTAECAGFADRKTCAGWRCVDDSTNLNGAVVKTLGFLDDELARSEVPWRDGAMVVFTDGTDQAARVSQGAA